MRATILFLPAAVVSASVAAAQTRKTLDIYVVDVEGGNAVLFAAPSGESVLVDTGNGGDGAVRDAGRIMAVVKDAGVQQIDHALQLRSRTARLLHYVETARKSASNCRIVFAPTRG